MTGMSIKAALVTISGSVGAGGAGATIAYTGGSATADGSGNYSFSVSYDWSGTVTPSKSGYTFSPASRSYTNVTANQTAQDYTATLNTYTISGSYWAAGAGATITYTGGSTTADSVTGNYSFTINHGWSGTVTPSKAGYAFTPASRTYSVVTANQTSQDYTAGPIMYTISGTTGTAGAGATITYTGGSTTANIATGVYSFTVASGWSGTVTPSKTGYTFSPASRSYTNVTANQTAQDYTADHQHLHHQRQRRGGGRRNHHLPWRLDHRGWLGELLVQRLIRLVWHGHTFQDRLYLLACQQKLLNVTANQTASELHRHAGHVHHQRQRRDGRGRCNHHLHWRLDHRERHHGELLVHRPLRLDWHGHALPSPAIPFHRPIRSYTNVTANQTNQNYTATAITYTISGNAGVGGATLSYTDGTPKTATANSSGAYTFQVSYNWSGTVTPSRTGFAFMPASRTYTNVTCKSDRTRLHRQTDRIHFCVNG